MYCKKQIGCKVKSVIIDDGIGSFFSSYKWIGFSKDSFVTKIKKVIYSFGMESLAKINFGKEINFGIFNYKTFMNQDLLHYYKIAAEYLDVEREDVFEPNSVLYLDTIFASDSEREESMEQVNGILARYYDEGKKIYIKSHPRSTVEFDAKDYEYTKLKQADSAENLIAKSFNRPEIVIGWGSTALGTISSFWGIECLSLYNIFDHRIEDYVKLEYKLSETIPHYKLAEKKL